MINDDMIKAVEVWQTKSNFHELTCGVDSNHALLVAKEINGAVVLVCETCGYIQKFIPNCIFSFYEDYQKNKLENDFEWITGIKNKENNNE